MHRSQRPTRAWRSSARWHWPRLPWYAASPRLSRLVVCSVAIAAAMSAKYSAVYLLPVAAVVFLVSSLKLTSNTAAVPHSGTQSVGAVLYSALVVCLVLPLWWAGHLFGRATPEQLADQDQSEMSPGCRERAFADSS